MEKNSMFESEKIDVFLIGMYNYENRVFGIQIDRNIIMELDEIKKKVMYYDQIPGLSLNKKNFHRVCVVNKKAYFVPFECEWLYIYDFEKDSYRKIQIKLDGKKIINNKGLFYEIVVWREQVVLLPFTYRGIIFINLITEEQYDLDIENDYMRDSDPILFRKYVEVDDEKIIVSSLSSNKLMVLDLENRSYRCSTVGEDIVTLGGIYRIDDKLYILCKNYLKIWESDLNLSYVKELDFLNDLGLEKNERLVYFNPEAVEEYNGLLYLFPAKWTHALKIDLKRRNVDIITSMEKYCLDKDINRNNSIFDGATRVDKYIFLHYQLGKILCFNMETEEIIEYLRKFENRDNILLKNFLNKVRSYVPNILDDRKIKIYDYVK